MFRNRKTVNNQYVQDVSNALHITPELAMILIKRSKEDFVNLNELSEYLYSDSVPYVPFPHVDEAVALINKHILAGCKIAVINDYDVDGITSGFIASEMLRFLGVETTVIASDRITEGYSITKPLIDRAKEFDASLIITTDNGITAFEQVEYAKELGMEVLITDHHEPIIENGAEKLPTANVIVEPKLADCNYPMREICGAVVTMKVAEILLGEENLKALGKENLIPYAGGLLGGFLELSGIATIMDVMPLVGENRVIVKNALRRINNGSYFVGLRQLAAKMKIELGQITSNRIAFGIGPCFNAESRMTGKITKCLSLLYTKDNNEAEKIAAELISINEKRKEASAKLEEEFLPVALESKDNVIFVYTPNNLHTLCGILAGRITEKTGKPCIVATDNPNGELSGSGRSVEKYDMITNLRKFSDLFEKLGGHTLACGMTISKDNFETLKNVVNDAAKNLVFSEEDTLVDLIINPCFIRNEFLNEVNLLEPYGEENKELVIAAKNCTLFDMQSLGKTGDYRKCRLMDDIGNIFEGLLFSDVSGFEATLTADFGADSLENLKKSRGNYKVDVVYDPRFHTWNGNTEIQYILKDYQRAGSL